MCDDRYHDTNINLHYNNAIRSVAELHALAMELRNSMRPNIQALYDIDRAVSGNDRFGKGVNTMLAKTQNTIEALGELADRLDEIAGGIKESAEKLRAGKQGS